MKIIYAGFLLGIFVMLFFAAANKGEYQRAILMLNGLNFAVAFAYIIFGSARKFKAVGLFWLLCALNFLLLANEKSWGMSEESVYFVPALGALTDLLYTLIFASIFTFGVPIVAYAAFLYLISVVSCDIYDKFRR